MEGSQSMSQLHERRRGGKGEGGVDGSPEDDGRQPPAPKPRALLAPAAAVLGVVVAVLLFLQSNRPTSHSPSGLRLFTPAELQKYDGQWHKRIYLAVMGHVFDVTPGAKHYAKDGSRAFVTGKFQDELTDDVADFDGEQFQELVRWRDFYLNHKEYKLVGNVVGRFFDSKGQPTALLGQAEDQAKQETEARAQRRQQQQQQKQQQQEEQQQQQAEEYKPCNVRWTKAEGGAVWCQTGQFPRQVVVPGREGQPSTRCACFAEDTVSAARHLYPGCPRSAESCSTSPPGE